MSQPLTLRFLVENTSCEDEIVPEHGLAVSVEFNGWRGLYDTGQTALVCRNALAMGVRLDQLDWIALSHGHYDHTGGLLPVLREAPGRIRVHAGLTVFEPKFARREDGEVYPNGIPASRAEVAALAAGIEEHAGECAPIAEGVYLIGPAPLRNPCEGVMPRFLVADPAGDYMQDTFVDERSLVIDTAGGLVVMTGCAHRGPINILLHARELFPDRDIFGIFGGFHLNYATPETLENKARELQRLNIRVIGLAHCTGGRASRFLHERLGENCFLCPAGTELEIEHAGGA